MSLNRFEQTLYDYVKSHTEERQHWQHKVRAILADSVEVPRAVGIIDSELWRYYEERSAAVPSFGGTERVAGLRRTSMKNLAELLIRLWTEPKPKKPVQAEPEPEFKHRAPGGF